MATEKTPHQNLRFVSAAASWPPSSATFFLLRSW
jgi:hypothetical protein